MGQVKTRDFFPPQTKFASFLVIVASLVLFIAKFWAYRLTNSQAIYSDAMESIVNIITAIVGFAILYYASLPADEDHPYGHGKAEYMSAALEGGLIGFAAILIGIEAVESLLKPPTLQSMGWGLLVIAMAGGVNCLLGLYLQKVGRKHGSLALEASGKHLLVDFWTSLGVIAGLLLTIATNFWWLDPLVALAICSHLGKESYQLIRRAIGGLLDAEESATLERLKDLINRIHPEGIIQIHHLRVMRAGRYHHIDAHVVVPEYWSVEKAHDETKRYERHLFKYYEFNGEFHFHMDPCRRLYCQYCNVQDCPVRQAPFTGHRKASTDELRNPEEPRDVMPKGDD